jgi:hypothetical protein
MQLNNPDMHPSQFQNVNKNANTLIQDKLALAQIKLTPLAGDDVKTLTSPGKHNFTNDDKQLSDYNQRSLFKNLYGDTLLTDLFFSKKNIQNIQNVLRYLVYQEMGYIIDNQSNNELMVIMRSIFLEYSEHPMYINEQMDDETKKKILQQYTQECDRLNQLVINESLPRLCSGLQQYLSYLHDASTPIRPIPPPINDSISGTRDLRSITQILTGSSL